VPQERGTEADLVTTSDGRILAVEATGSERGAPVFLLHGTPGSRTGPKPRSSVLHWLGVRLICYDRPGYGRSTRHVGRTVADAAADVAAIARHYGYDRFAVVGRSGGGPHALACAALLPGRVVRTAALVSVAPPDATGLDWYKGMSAENVSEYQTSETNADLLAAELSKRAAQVAKDPLTLIDFLDGQMPDSDRGVLKDVALRKLFSDSYREALLDGRTDGWYDDVLALRRPWGFSLDSIHTPVRLWHGADDTFAPSSHTEWLGRHIPGAEAVIESGVAHFGAVDVLPDVLSWLASPEDGSHMPPPEKPLEKEPSRPEDLVGARRGAGRLLGAVAVPH
jgi:pimeloyl-ACP methyl ester carboxylesterase